MPITCDNYYCYRNHILTLWGIVSTVLGGSAIVREATRGELRAGTVVRGVTAVIGLVIVLWGLVLTLGL